LSDNQVRRLNAKDAKFSEKVAKEGFFASLCENLCVLCVQIMSDYLTSWVLTQTLDQWAIFKSSATRTRLDIGGLSVMTACPI